MDQSQALNEIGALSQETRLNVLRRLVREGAPGLAAGEIAESMGVSPSNLSFHLKELEHAGLIAARREARSVIYSANYDGLRALIGFLMRDCCANRPEICAPRRAGSACGS